MALRLYGYASSTCTRRVRMILTEYNVEHEFVTINVFKKEQKQEEYINTKHPFGKIPVLVDEATGIQVFESRAIAHYIALKFRRPDLQLVPPETELELNAHYQQALSIEQSYFDPVVGSIIYENVLKQRRQLGVADPIIVQAELNRLRDVFSGYQRILSKQTYLAGNEITLADLFHIPYGVLAEPFGFMDLLQDFPIVKKWWLELRERQSWIMVTK
ncbi:glutathione S-transferase [Fusarium mexicanum]|uniref:glutathione transferase n=1 Tax=Fusarium mexicanum TaxID=751941 RepID=A0A8H5JG03_9HYPO|nr:glutathione S-transferase [Fusarium mexicanum]